MNRGKDILSLKDFSRDQIERLFKMSDEIGPIASQKRRLDLLREKVMAVLFYQSSTRTRLSFETAMIRLGGSVIGFADVEQSRAGGVTKESLKDTAQMIQGYADVAVIRHTEDFAAAEFAKHLNIPVINGGDGGNEHPTQGLLDLYTIQKELGHIDGIKVLVWGRMTYRAVHSFLYGLAKFRNVQIYLYSPEEWKMPENYRKDYEKLGLACKEINTYEDAIREVDVIYMHPVRRGRDVITENEFVLDREKLKNAKKGAIVMHILPRTDELPEEVDDTPFAKYYIQAFNGIVMRMALLRYIFNL
ncbi:MAG: aspartate carbamoyltransferase [Thermodesulfobacteriota bacterium]|jgi:aspartate carbamoyltransferase catalytic subunit